jgi:alpha-ketoglutarate-dependent 2,4-dichlorophenoxyacetate dioxygenase
LCHRRRCLRGTTGDQSKRNEKETTDGHGRVLARCGALIIQPSGQNAVKLGQLRVPARCDAMAEEKPAKRRLEATPMNINVCPVTPNFAAEIGDVDLAAPLDPSDVTAIKDAFAKYAVLIFPDQHLSQDQHLDFARHFGPLETTIALFRKDAKLRVPKEFADVSNLDPENEVWGKESRQRMFQLGNRLWHTDSSFKHLPARASLLYARSIPPVGGHTEFADERAAYDALPEDLKRRLENLVAEHSIFNSRARLGFSSFSDEERQGMPAVPQILVRTIAESGRKSLYLASHAGRIFGMPEAEGRALIDQLVAHATQRQFIYTHRWRVHDLVIWDDRCTMHRGTDFDDLRWKRDMQRATVCDVANTCEQEGVAVAAA